MDLNDLPQRHQVALFNAQNAFGDEARRIHQAMAGVYAGSKCPTQSPSRVG
jgi:hypothetical protein